MELITSFKLSTINDGIFTNEEYPINGDTLTYIVSVIGKPHTGKTTFLNCLCTYISNQNCKPFPNVSNDINGIYLELNGVNVLFLDYPSLDLNSINDVKLMTFAYLVSDVIILNERHVISNSTLKLFDSLVVYLSQTGFSRYSNPELIFRVIDADKNLDVKDDTFLMYNNDSNDSIKHFINESFDIHIIKEDILTDQARKCLEEDSYDKYIEFISNDNFKYIIDILSQLSMPEVNATDINYASMISNIIMLLNTTPIPQLNLDVVTNNVMSDIRDWANNNKMVIYVEPTGKESIYRSYMCPLYDNFYKLLDDYDTRFCEVPMNLANEYRVTMRDNFTKEFYRMYDANLTAAENQLLLIINNYLLNYNNIAINNNKSFFLCGKEYFMHINTLKNKVKKLIKTTDLSEHAKHNVCCLINYQFKSFLKNLKKQKRRDIKDNDNVLKKLNKNLENAKKTVNECTNKYIRHLGLPYDSIIQLLEFSFEKTFDEILLTDKTYCLKIKSLTRDHFQKGSIIFETEPTRISETKIDITPYVDKYRKELENNREKFIENRNRYLQDNVDYFINEQMKKKYREEKDYNDGKLSYSDVLKLYDVLKKGENDVMFLDILAYVKAGKKHLYNHVKYEMELNKIFSKEEFCKRYNERIVRCYDEFKKTNVKKMKEEYVRIILSELFNMMTR
uniref:G domain-containing protein n=1 Tax=viral metagenome TaxID=1070528 RepID=A0A6C0ED67_9ZZZZ